MASWNWRTWTLVLLLACTSACRSTRPISEHFVLEDTDAGTAHLFARAGELETYLGTLVLDPLAVADDDDAEPAMGRSSLPPYAVAADGRAVVYLHDAKMSLEGSQLGAGIYRSDAVGRRALLFPMGDLQRFEATYPRPLPNDVLVFQQTSRVDPEGRRRALRADGPQVPVALLGGNELHQAAWDGERQAARQLSGNPSVRDATTYWGLTALDVAIVRGHDAVAAQLLRRGADWNKSAFETLPLAATYARLDVIDALLERGAGVDDTRIPGGTALLVALAPDRWNVLPATALFGDPGPARADPEQSSRMVAALLERGADPNVPDAEGRTAMFWATRQVDVATLRRLLAAGGRLDLRDHEGNLPLHGLFGPEETSAEGGRDWDDHVRPVLELVIAHTRQLDVQNADALTPLQLAARHGALRSAEILIKQGADDDVRYVPTGADDQAVLTVRERLAQLRAALAGRADAPGGS